MATKTTRTQKDIDKAVERYIAGEDVMSLARQYGVSRAGFYLWVKKAKEKATAARRIDEIGVKGVEHETKINLSLENKSLHAEVERLRKALFDMMVKHKEL